MRKGILLSAMAATIALPATVPAQTVQHAEASMEIEDSSLLTPVNGIYRIGQCVVRHDRGTALRLLEMLPVDGEPRLQEAARTIADAGCLGESLPVDFPVYLRGAIAQEMLRTDFTEMRGEPYSVARLVDFGLPVESDSDPAESAQPYRWSDCVVRNDGDNVERLMRTPPGSEGERRVLVRMRAYMSACMSGQTEFAASAPEIRSLFMQSAYHSLYRYWNGDLSAAGESGVDNPAGRIVCRTYVSTDSRVRTERICMSPRDWARARHTTQEQVDAFIRSARARPQ